MNDTGSGAVQIDFAIRNEMKEWSVMKPDAVVKLMTAAGEEKPCGTVKLGSGGHYIPPNFQLRGYTLKDKSVQTLQVLCEGVSAKDATKLKISYSYVLGEYDYYAQDKNKIEDEQEVPLDAIAKDLKYPFENTSGINAVPTTDVIPALNKCTLKLAKIERSDDGFTFQWQVENPGEYGTLVHIGNPPVIGDDGIIYGHRVSPDIIQVPVADPKGTAQWETKVTLPKEVKNIYMLLSVEQRRERLFANILMDLTQY